MTEDDQGSVINTADDPDAEADVREESDNLGEADEDFAVLQDVSLHSPFCDLIKELYCLVSVRWYMWLCLYPVCCELQLT